MPDSELQETIEKINAKRAEIEEKIKNGVELTVEELWMIGDQMLLDVLPQHTQCMDMYYRRLYIHYMENVGPNFGPLTDEHMFNFQMLVHGWPQVLDCACKDGSLIAASKKETKIEIDQLEKKWREEQNASDEEKDEDAFRLLAWSKFRHILIRKIFDLDIKANFYSLNLNGKEIRFDMESAMHILSRHFGHGMKPYRSMKDHFYGVFPHDQLHLEFKQIFNKIDETGVYINDDVADINIRYKCVIYKIWALPINDLAETYRISTFFPISSSKIIDKLQKDYKEVPIADELSIFIRKVQD